jgi:hypothetical protein
MGKPSEKGQDDAVSASNRAFPAVARSKEHHPYDRTMKSLVDSNPEAIARFVLHEWRKRGRVEQAERKISKVVQLSAEFPDEELEGDGVFVVKGPEGGAMYLLEIEFQSDLHSYMPLRCLEYLIKAMRKHWKAYGDLPVLAAVIYLRDMDKTPDSLKSWPAPYGLTSIVFHYLSISLKEMSREDLLALGEPALWPLALMTKEGVDRSIVKTMFAALLEQKLYKSLPIGYTIAGWFLQGEDLEWLHKEYRNMFNFFKDSPALQWMQEDALQMAMQKVRPQVKQEVEQEVRQEFQQKLLEEQKLAEKKLLEEQKLAEKKLLEERKKSLTILRQNVVELVSQRFPKLKRLAQTQVRRVKEQEPLQQVMLPLSLAHDSDEAEEVLYSLSEKEDDQDE